ncbi:MAG: acyltransferase family protein [Hungatella sp.]
MKEREIKYDFLRAVAVLAIIMVHAIPAVSVNDKQWWFAAVMQPLLLSFVGIYFMLSGLFLLDSATGDITQFYKKRVKVIVIPFLFLSRKLRKSAKIVYNGLEIKNHITKERM